MTTNSKEKALTPRQFELLLEGARRIEKERQQREAVFAILVLGRLGFRAGELIHSDESWIDWRNRRFIIPRQEDCSLGKDGAVCGYCEQLAEQMVTVYQNSEPEEMSRERERFINKHLDRGFERGDDLDVDDILQLRWFAKTDAAAREVPFGHDARTELHIERFFQTRDEWGMSKSALNRRLNKALRHADELTVDTTMPHGLRATAASALAAQQADPLTLKSFMGWASFQTAKCYISESADRTERALFQMRSI